MAKDERTTWHHKQKKKREGKPRPGPLTEGLTQPRPTLTRAPAPREETEGAPTPPAAVWSLQGDLDRLQGYQDRSTDRPERSYRDAANRAGERHHMEGYSPYPGSPERTTNWSLHQEQPRTATPDRRPSPPSPPHWVPPQRKQPGTQATPTLGLQGNRATIIRGIPWSWTGPKVLQALEIATKRTTSLAQTSRTFAKRLPRGDWVVTHRTPEEAKAMIQHGNQITLNRQDGTRIPITVHTAGGTPRTTIAEEPRGQLVCRLPDRFGGMLEEASLMARRDGRPVLDAHKALIQQWLGESADKVTGRAMGKTGAILLTFRSEAAASEAASTGVEWKTLRLRTKGIPKRPDKHETQPPHTLKDPTHPTETGTELSKATPWIPIQRSQPTVEASRSKTKVQEQRHEGSVDRDWLSNAVEVSASQEAARSKGRPGNPMTTCTGQGTRDTTTGMTPQHQRSTSATTLTETIRRSVEEAANAYDSEPPTQDNRLRLVQACILGIVRAFLMPEAAQVDAQGLLGTLDRHQGTKPRLQLSDPPG
jgi:hypothetical protein